MSANTSASPFEVSWFGSLCDDDYEFLGHREPSLRSTFEHCRGILQRAEEGGFDNILLPSGYQLGIDTIAFASAMAPLTSRIRMLMAVRCAELFPPQLARQLATVQEMLQGRSTINIISSDLPGAPVDSAPRYARSLEVMSILRTLLNGEDLSHQGEFYNLELEAPRVCKETAAAYGGCPPFYFGGISPAARETAAAAADVFLMWPDVEKEVTGIVEDMRARATAHGRRLKFGYRVHVIVRESEGEAMDYTRRLMRKFDADKGAEIKGQSLDSKTEGVRRQDAMRANADADGFAEDHLWTGIGRARSGCSAALVGDPDQIAAKINRYAELGMGAFILSGYPHATECDLFARYVLPQLNHGPLTLD
ncbi:MAG: LLM class flavin-dependent oxidoreductase [Alphaproteobacteria bacterium]